MKKSALVLILAAFLTEGCGEKTDEQRVHAENTAYPHETAQNIAAHNDGSSLYAGYDVKKLLEEFHLRSRTASVVSVRPDHVQITEKEGAEPVNVPLPKEEFYISIAPYINTTHPCTYHNLISCKAEFPNTQMYVKVADEQGAVIFEKDVTTFQNGFFDLWVPRGRKVAVTVSYGDKQATEILGTSSNDRTCITTMRLN